MVGVKSNETIRILREKFGSMNFALLIWIIKGMAAILSVDSNLADFATISATGKKTLLVSVEQGPNQRSREDIQQYNIVTNVNLGKLLPQNGVLTFLLITPLAKKRLLRIRPLNQDIKLKQLDNTDDSAKRQYFK
jgi:cell surface protein SprA